MSRITWGVGEWMDVSDEEAQKLVEDGLIAEEDGELVVLDDPDTPEEDEWQKIHHVVGHLRDQAAPRIRPEDD
jgi:hypothetical protein